MEIENHTESIRAIWLVKCIKYTAEEINKPIIDTAELLNKHGLVEWVLNGYGSFHTQGYEYMAELLSGTLREQLEA